MSTEEVNERGKAALITAHQECLRHVPNHARDRCSRCGVPIPCPAVRAHVVVMVEHGHLTCDLDRKHAEHGEHACEAWIWPYHF